MVELTCKVCDDTTVACDEDVVSVTCSYCSMIDLVGKLGELSDEEVETLANSNVRGVA